MPHDDETQQQPMESNTRESKSNKRHSLKQWPNNFILNTYTSRTFLEVQIGNLWSVHVVVQLRRQDVPWFHSDLSYHEEQLMDLIQEYIIPKEFPELILVQSEQIQEIQAKKGDSKQAKQVVIGETNIRQQKEKAKVHLGKSNKKSTTAGKNKRGKNETTTTKSIASALSLIPTSKTSNKREYKPDVTMLFGETLQITYKMEDITYVSLTLLYKKDDNANKADEICDELDDVDSKDSKTKKCKAKTKTGEKEEASDQQNTMKLASFRQLKTLPRRIVLWCYPFDQSSPTKPNPGDSGFPRPEMIPITSLFRHRDDD